MAFNVGSFVGGLFDGFKSGQELMSARNKLAIENQLAEANLESLKNAKLKKDQGVIRENFTDTGDTPGFGGSGSSTPPPAPDTGKGGKGTVANMTADSSLPPEARALLDTIAGPESGGAYNARWKGKTFDSYDKHPQIYEPGPAGDSSAAGRYQMVWSTYGPLAQKYGYTNFQPATQDQAAWQLAQDTFQQKTGGNLLEALKAGKYDAVRQALKGQWATLNFGPYQSNLNKYMNLPAPTASVAGPTDEQGLPVTGRPTAAAGPTAAPRSPDDGGPMVTPAPSALGAPAAPVATPPVTAAPAPATTAAPAPTATALPMPPEPAPLPRMSDEQFAQQQRTAPKTQRQGGRLVTEDQFQYGGTGPSSRPAPTSRPSAPAPDKTSALSPPPALSGATSNLFASARQAPDGKHYVPDPNRPGKYLQVNYG